VAGGGIVATGKTGIKICPP
jgi:hypothetical protein